MHDPSALCVSPSTTVTRTRRLPVEGELLVSKGDCVENDTIVARASIAGEFQTIKASTALNVSPRRVAGVLRVSPGDPVKKGDLLGETGGLFGLIRNRLVAQTDGIIEEVSSITGQVVIAKPPTPLSLHAYLPGKVIETSSNSTVTINANISIVQGIFGIGGEAFGWLKCISSTDEAALLQQHDDMMRDTVIAIDGPVSDTILIALKQRGVRGVIAASATGMDLNRLVGHPLNPATTGNEPFGMTVMLTEGFGAMPMSGPAKTLLFALDNQRVSLSGTTQVRAGVIRPEVIGPPLPHLAQPADGKVGAYRIGTTVRIVRGAAFGTLATITAMPSQPAMIPSGVKTLVFTVTLPSGETATIPRANVEWVENG